VLLVGLTSCEMTNCFRIRSDLRISGGIDPGRRVIAFAFGTKPPQEPASVG